MNPPETSALILYNDPQAAAELSQVADSTSVLGVLAEVNAVAAALGRLHIPCRAVPVGSLQDCPGVLNDAPEPLVFNLVEEFPAEPEAAAHVPALCTAFGKACTGADSACLQLTLDKPRTKAVLAAADLPVPAGVMVEPGAACDPALLPPPPWIVKPARADASEGITGASSIHSQADKAFRRNLETVHRSLGQPALVEQLVGDRELNVSVLERNGCPQVLPLAEIDFSAFAPGKARIVDYAAKWLATSFEYRHTPRIIPAPLPAAVAAAIRAAALKAWRVTRCRDYARIDVRMSGDGVFHILEVNANPDIAPDAGFAAALDAAGIAYDDFVRDVAENARQRHQRQDSSAPPVRQPERHPDAAVKTRSAGSDPAGTAAYTLFPPARSRRGRRGP